ncbi:mitochondrial protein cyt-4 [Naviculisporaceae sp. PSN 640]
MLRSSNKKAYVCWRCLCSSPSSSLPTSGLRQPRLSATTSSLSIRSTQIRGLTSHRNDEKNVEIQFRFQGGAPTRIRQQLRTWEIENPVPIPFFETHTSEPSFPVNTTTDKRGKHIGFLPAESDVAPRLHGGELVNLGEAESGLQPGDLLEISSANMSIPMLAVCLGNFNGCYHFYTETGKWFAVREIFTRFVIRKFIDDPGELQTVIDAIPTTAGEERVLKELSGLNIGPTRTAGESLRARMEDFLESARQYNHVYSESLNRAGSLAGPVEKLMTLEEIAKALLPSAAASKNSLGPSVFSPSLLYAVHSSICQNHDLVFRSLRQNDRRYQDYLYSVMAEPDLKVIHDVEDTFRKAFEKHEGGSLMQRIDPQFELFIQRAQQAIDRSRRSRDWAPGGMLSPAHKALAAPKFRWSSEDMKYVTFMRAWAASGRFPGRSRLHWIGAAILRATDRYPDAEFLDSVTGWTFLQEIGWTMPWDIFHRHHLRLPGQVVHGSETEMTSVEEPQLGPDMLESIRTGLEGPTVYCIDSEKAEDIDDGVSLERTEKKGEYWVNIHVADPASRIAPNSALGKQAAAKAQTTYLSGFIEPMFAAEVVRESFSLAADRPSLTFSARVNEAGEILDYKISPHVLKDVVYMTPEDASTVAGEDPNTVSPFSVPSTCFEVGTPPASRPSPTRKMKKPDELSKKHIQDIKILNQLAKALHENRLRAGAVPAFAPRPRAEVSLENTTTEVLREGFVHCTGDPYIRVSYESGTGSVLVSSLMQLAGNIAARWCNDRKIPIPYRTQLLGEQDAPRLKKFTQEVLYPKLLAGQNPTVEEMRTYLNLQGGFTLSTRPRPYMSMGLDMYTKATSPLRRYADLLVHWQIEAALLEESLRGSSGTDGEKPAKPKHSLLPFSRETLNETILPHLLLRERYSKRLANGYGNQAWILQALARAWRFGERKEQLPETFKFTVEQVEYGNRVHGRLDWFDLRSRIPVRGLGGILSTDIKVGDEFIVELTDVDVYNGFTSVKVVKKVEASD